MKVKKVKHLVVKVKLKGKENVNFLFTLFPFTFQNFLIRVHNDIRDPCTIALRTALVEYSLLHGGGTSYHAQ